MLNLIPTVSELLKYVLEGSAVALAAFYIPQRKTDPKDIALIALTAALSFWLLDKLAPRVGSGMRQGAGFGVGYGMVGGAEPQPHEFATQRCPVSEQQDQQQDAQYAAAEAYEHQHE